eukprot:1136436-Pelagomonas_calceolata.AAC.2
MGCQIWGARVCWESSRLELDSIEGVWTGTSAILLVQGNADVLTAFWGLQRGELYEQSIHDGSVVKVKEFAIDLRTRLCRVGNGLDSVEPRGHNHKRITYHFWFASPLNPVSAEAAPYKPPRYLNLDLGRHVQRNLSCYRLRTHTLGVERACWQSGVNGHCDSCGLQDLQDEKHALFNCASICALRDNYAHLFFETSPQPRGTFGPTSFHNLRSAMKTFVIFLSKTPSKSRAMCRPDFSGYYLGPDGL